MKLFSRITLASIFSMLVANTAFAWGERGHDLITRVAVQNLRSLTDDNQAVVKPFVARDHMLAHLSNVPDIVWRAPYMSDADRTANFSTHFINLERVYEDVGSWEDLPMDYLQYTKDAKAKELRPTEVGTAPWRILQLYGQLVAALQEASNVTTEKELEDRVNKALLYAGIMSHFVGDLANPHHTTANYDGQLTGQRGLHGYFETDVVAELPMDLALEIQTQAKESWLNAYSEIEKADILGDPQKLVWALLANSHRNLPRLLALDKKHSLLKPGKDDKDYAERKTPKQVAEQYQSFAVERLAVGASALSQLWLLAWQEAGSPDLSKFRSYHYPVQPDFIAPTYIDVTDVETTDTQAIAAEKSGDEWRKLDLDNVLVMELESGRVVMELAPQFAPKHVENIRLLVKEGYFDGTFVLRSQDNYVAQWGDPEEATGKTKSLGSAVEKIKVEFFRDPQEVGFETIKSRDAYADQVGFTAGFPTASDGKRAWLTHCYGMVGVSRGMGDDSGNGSGLYAVTGHAPRHLDLNVTLVGRVLEGMEHLTTLPRGTGELGFYETPEEFAPIKSVKLASSLPKGTIDLEVMRTDSEAFRKHVAARTTRTEEWFLEPTGKIELCNVAVPMRAAEK